MIEVCDLDNLKPVLEGDQRRLVLREDVGSVNAEKQSDDPRRILEKVSNDEGRIAENPIQERTAENHNLEGIRFRISNSHN